MNYLPQTPDYEQMRNLYSNPSNLYEELQDERPELDGGYGREQEDLEKRRQSYLDAIENGRRISPWRMEDIPSRVAQEPDQAYEMPGEYRQPSQRQDMMGFIRRYGGYGAAVPFLAAGLGGLMYGLRDNKRRR